MIYKERKILALSVLLIMALGLAACGSPGASAAPASSAYSKSPATAMPVATSSNGSGSSGAAAPTQAAAAGPSTPAQVALGKSAQYSSFLVDDKGMTLYLYTKDSPNTTVCYGKCATFWPPLLTSGAPVGGEGLDASKLGTISRTDGTTQVTYNGWPLYYYAKDKQAGDTSGENVGSVWFLVSPSGEAVK